LIVQTTLSDDNVNTEQRKFMLMFDSSTYISTKIFIFSLSYDESAAAEVSGSDFM